MEEIFDIYTRDGKYTGKELKSVCHSKNAIFYHKHDRIYYDAVRTVRDTLISYKQDYTINKTTTNITYLAEGTARLNIEDEISAPNTGVDTNNSNYLYLLLVLIPLGYVSIKKLVK